ncbi:MAG: glycosyltransferase family 2 protein [Selenomonadaceae bacterium]|nr:glycosyltransferase family 2 protein [Selenomonadaceae bacterium]
MNRKKIVVISMVKNEADVIESFARHVFTFADELIIADHTSGDKTYEILTALKDEGLPIFLSTYRQVELAHAEVMNDLLQRALYEHGADLVLPMDGDEFLVNTENDTPCRAILETLDESQMYCLRWRQYEPRFPHEEEARFLLSRPCRRTRDFVGGQKTIVGAQIAKQAGFCLGQGTHFAYWADGSGQVPTTVAPVVHTAHFHWRSDEQYAAKVATSWINNVAKYSNYTPTANYLKEYYYEMAQGLPIQAENQLKDPEDFDLTPYVTELPLRYSTDVRPKPLRNLMGAAVLMAEAYHNRKVLEQKQTATVVLPYADDVADLERRLTLALAENYPHKEIFILNNALDGVDIALPPELKGQVTVLRDTSTEDTLEQLARLATGEFFQWILPGEKAQPDKLMAMVASISSQDYPLKVICSNGHIVSPDANGRQWTLAMTSNFMMLKPAAWLELILKNGFYPAEGLAAVLMRRAVVEECQWFKGCFLDGTPLPFVMWVVMSRRMAALWPVYACAIFQEPRYEQDAKVWTAADFSRHQLEWQAARAELGA